MAWLLLAVVSLMAASAAVGYACGQRRGMSIGSDMAWFEFGKQMRAEQQMNDLTWRVFTAMAEESARQQGRPQPPRELP